MAPLKYGVSCTSTRILTQAFDLGISCIVMVGAPLLFSLVGLDMQK